MFTAPITADDLTTCFAAVDALDALACDADFTAFCDERRDAWVDAVEADTDH